MNTDPFSPFQKPTEIIAFLNETYRQACIEFYPVLAQEKEFDFDLPSSNAGGVPDGRLEATNSSLEWLRVNNDAVMPLNPKGGLNLILVHRFTVEGPGATIPTTDRAFVQTAKIENVAAGHRMEYFLVTCAHEIGHCLGISTRKANFGGGNPYHDPGNWPGQYYYMDGTLVSEPMRLRPDVDPKQRMTVGLMGSGYAMGEKGDWRWLRREDWLRANTNARSKQTLTP